VTLRYIDARHATCADMDEVSKHSLGKKILRVSFHNTMTIGDIWGMTILLDDGSEIWIDARAHDDYLITAKIVPLGGA